MAWAYLLLAGVFEIFWATMMKLSNGFSKLNFSIYTIVGLVISLLLLAKAIKTMPMSLAYSIWTGIGAAGSVIIGVWLFKDQLSGMTWFFVALLIISIIGIKLTSGQ